MTDKVEFPGGWARLRDPQDVTERQRRPLAKLQRRLAASGVGEVLQQRAEMGEEVSDKQVEALIRPVLAHDEWDLLDDSGDLLIVALVEEWSFDLPIAVESVQNLPGSAYRRLRETCDPLLTAVLNLGVEDDITDPDSPTTPGSG